MKRKYFLPLFLLFQIIFLQILPFFPKFVEQFYSNGFYQFLSKFERIIFGKIPFSVGDCIYGILILLIICWFWYVRNNWRQNYKDYILKIVSCFSVFYFLFHTLWAFNYYRQPLFEKMNIAREYSDADLLDFIKKLIKKTNEIQYKITKNDSLTSSPTDSINYESKVVFPYAQKQAFSMTLNGYNTLAKTHKYFTYNNLSIKKSLFSVPLTYMGFAGYLNPFTNEAQVNDLLPMYNFPMTACHEMAHQIGYASENECNFIGFLASIKNDDLYFKYAGYGTALRYCINNIMIRNPELGAQLLKTIHPGILKNYQETETFWDNYNTFINDGFYAFYDQFLKTNHQKDGMDSYSKFVDLMINYYEDRELE